MTEILIYYVIPNVVLFGSLYLIAKFVETVTEDFINNYDERYKQLLDFMSKRQ